MILDDWLNALLKYFTREHLVNFALALVILFGGIFVASRSRNAVQKFPQLDVQQRLLLQKFTYYGLIGLTIAAFMTQLGFDLKVILGAAGILTVAIGFAAQTSASNLISGVFLMVERPFVVGDIISVGDTSGEVMSVDLISSKIRTFSNLMVRIPNEKLVKSDIINYSYFPVRRVDFKLNIGFEADPRFVEGLLRQVATEHPLCLEEPKPVFIVSGFTDFAVALQFQVWTLTANMGKLQNDLYREIKMILAQNQIYIPYPHQVAIAARPD